MANEVEIISAPPVESPAAEPATQATDPVSQENEQPQETGKALVESPDNKPQVTETQRRRPSDYYRERERIRRLEETLTQQSKRMEEMTSLLKDFKKPESSPADEGKFDPNEFWKNPNKVLSAREQRLLKEVEALKAEVSQWKTSQTQSEQAKHEREALELLFPKSSPDSEETLAERADVDPDRAERIYQVMKKYKLQGMIDSQPREAAQLILELLEKDKPKAPTVIPKKLMGGTAKGTPAVGGAKLSSMEEKRAELRRLSEEASNNPELRFDENHRTRREQLIRDLERLGKE
jgi:hypothetical protein